MTEAVKMQWVFDKDSYSHYEDTADPVNETTDSTTSVARVQWVSDTDISSSFIEWVNPNNEVTRATRAAAAIEYRWDEDLAESYALSERLDSSLILHENKYKKWNRHINEWEEVSDVLPTDAQFLEILGNFNGLKVTLEELSFLMDKKLLDNSTCRLFSQSLDLKKHTVIKTIKVTSNKVIKEIT